MTKKKNLFNLAETGSFKLSRSKVDWFLQCPRCFYLNRKLGRSPPGSAPYTFNNRVDALPKKEFDIYREKKKVYPFAISQKIDAVPFAHPEIDNWRNNKVGIQHLHEKPTFFYLV